MLAIWSNWDFSTGSSSFNNIVLQGVNTGEERNKRTA